MSCGKPPALPPRTDRQAWQCDPSPLTAPLDAYYRVMCELKESFGPRRVWVLTPCLPTGGPQDDTELRGRVPDALRAD